MSRRFVRSFFPAAAHQLESYPLSKFLFSELLFPEVTGVVCPEVQLWGYLRNPVLLFHAIMGGAIGFYCATKLLKIHGLWSAGFLFYGFMNMAAIPLHCFLPAVPRSPEHYPLLWIADTFWTGSSSSAVVCAVVAMYKADQRKQSSHRRRLVRLCVALIGLISAGIFLQDGNSTLPLELWYLLPTGVAATTVWFCLLHRMTQQQGADKDATQQALLLCSSAAALAVLGILLDSFFCHQFGQIFLDAMMAPTVVFMSCNIAFLALFQYLVQLQRGGKKSS